LIFCPDDGIVVVEVEKGDVQMDSSSVPSALQERLGAEATNGLVRLFNTAQAEWTANVVNLAVERFERRLVEEIAGVRVEMARSEARLLEEITRQCATLRQEIGQQGQETARLGAELRQETAANRFELLKWSFLFWIGQVVAVVGLVGVMLRTR